MRDRDLAIDYAKGIAILFVYLGHSVIYHPIELAATYEWCHILDRMITSFNMPMFFFISGLLFGYSKKDNLTVLKDKGKRLLIPYLFTMMLIIIAKQITPNEIAYKNVSGGGIIDLITYIFGGGDRWFVYVLIWIFLFSLPLRRVAKTDWVFVVIAIALGITIADVIPSWFMMDRVVWFISYFLLGMFLSQYYEIVRPFVTKFCWALLTLFILLNIVFVITLQENGFIWYVVLPLIGTALFMSMSFLIDNCWKKKGSQPAVVRYIEYCGKYSLQFYLFTFAYPVIRIVVVNVFHISSPFAIVALVMILQLIVITIIVEITRRIKWLKIPMGY